MKNTATQSTTLRIQALLAVAASEPEHGVTLTAAEALSFILFEEITQEELADSEYMLERFSTWSEC